MSSAPDTEHDKSVSVTLHGVTVTLSFRSLEFAELSGTDPDTILVLIDTSEEAVPLSVQVNLDPIFEEVVR